MSPGVNGGGSRNTGTLPKSNRRNDRNRERSAANQQNANRSAACHGHPQHFNNLVNFHSDNLTSISFSFSLYPFFFLFCKSEEKNLLRDNNFFIYTFVIIFINKENILNYFPSNYLF